MAKHILISGFPRGGTLWLRDLLSGHPDIHTLTAEYRLLSGKHSVVKATQLLDLTRTFSGAKCCLHKSPSDALGLPEAVEAAPQHLYVMIVRDPRDVVTSHVRSTMEWTKVGINGTVEGILKKLRLYWEKFAEVADRVCLTTYEDLHERPVQVLTKLWTAAGLEGDIEEAAKVSVLRNEFPHPGVEDRDSHRRMGIVGDYMNHLSTDDLKPLYRDPWWMRWMKEMEYAC